MSSEKIDRLRHELEAKDSTLLEAQRELASTQERYINLYNLAPVGHLTIDAAGVIRQTNDSALQILGMPRDRLVGETITRFTVEPDRQMYEMFQNKLFAEDAVQICELRLRRSDGHELYAELRGRRMAGSAATEALGFIVVTNVSERRKMNDALRRRNRELGALNQFARTVSDSPNFAEVIANLETMLLDSSDAAAGAIFAYDVAQNELQLERHWGSLRFIERLSTVPIGGSQLEHVIAEQIPFYTRNLQEVPWLANEVVAEDLADWQAFLYVPMVARGQVEGAIWLFSSEAGSITEDRIAYFGTLAQQAGIAMRSARLFAEVRHGQERLRLLTRKIVSAQEEERRRVSRELHDEAGQLLTALKLSLEMLGEDLQGVETDATAMELVRKQLASAIALSERTMAHIRGLVHNLRPTALDDLGLNSALEGLCHDFSQRRAVVVHYHQDVDDSVVLPASVQIVAYRFLQEALTNVSKHAQATDVQVLFQESLGNICLIVEDDGIGFDMNPATEGIGILGMRERLESVGGRLEIFSKPDNGTRLVAWIPTDS